MNILNIILAIGFRLALIVLVLRDKSVQEVAITWILLMMFLPVVGLLLYLVFGRNYRKPKAREYIHAEALRRFGEEISPEDAKLLFPEAVPDGIDPFFRTQARLSLACGEGNKVYEGNKTEVIRSGVRKRELLTRDLLAARESIHMEYFRFSADDSGKLVRDILIKKAQEGIEVRFLLNNFVARRIPRSFWKPMKEAGVQIVRYTSIKQGLYLFLMRLNRQQHRKIVVIDGRVGYMGGMNVSDNYFNLWQDPPLRIEGPAVARLQASFIDTWLSCKGTVERPLGNYFHPVKPYEGGKALQIVTDECDFPWPTMELAYEWMLGNAREYVCFQTPYFVPPGSFLAALKGAALRGVDVKVMLSKKVDTPIMGPFNRSYYSECLEAGVQIIECDGEFNHAKTMVADDYLSVVGASNLDVRSFSINNEVSTFIYDRETAMDFRQDFLKRMEDATVWTFESWKESLSVKDDIASRFVRLFYREF